MNTTTDKPYEVNAEGIRIYKIQIGRIYRDRNSFENLWGKVTDGPESDDFYVFEPLNGSEPYRVWGECLSLNAHH